MITLEVDGILYGGFKSGSVVMRLDALSRTFAFTSTSQDGKPLPFKGNEPCNVHVSGEQVLTGFIDVVHAEVTNVGQADHVITISGIDVTSDLLDSSISTLGSIGNGITLKALCERVIENIGSSLTVDDQQNPAPFQKAEDVANPDPGDNAFEFLERHARKKQVLLTSGPLGKLVIAKSEGTEIDAFIQNKIGDPGGANNVLRSSVSYDARGRFSRYRVAAQPNLNALVFAGVTRSDAVADQSSTDVEDKDMIDAGRGGRQFIVLSENMSSSTSAHDRALWEARIRKTRGRVYAATVSGYTDQAENLWETNTLVTVLDDDADINAKMLVNSVAFGLDRSSGPVTTLAFVERNAYKLTLEEPVTEEVGDDFFG